MDKMLFELYKSIKQMEKQYNDMIDEFNKMSKLLTYSEKLSFIKMMVSLQELNENEVKEKMNNKEQPTMQTVTALAKFLIDTWRESKCPGACLLGDCIDCKYKKLCGTIEELAKVVNK